MPKRGLFVHKLLKRLDRVDRQTLQDNLRNLAEEQELYEEILDQLEEGVLLISEDLKLVFANNSAVHSLGIPDAESEPRLSEALADANLFAALKLRLPKLTEKHLEDFTVLQPREKKFRVTIQPVQSSGRKFYLVLMLDRSAQADARFSEDNLSRIQAMVSLAAGIAHEIGNPLNAIGIHLGLLRKEIQALPAAKRKTMEKTVAVLNSETGRLDKIVKNFLKAARRPPLTVRPDNLNAVVSEVLSFLQPELLKHRIRVRFRDDEDLPAFLMDRGRLYQVVFNLIKNSMEAMPNGGDLSVNVNHRHRVAVLTVKDNGQGIAEADLPHIFEAYYTTKDEGSGLGLMTVYAAVREHGGRIEVASKPGKGTTFTIFLPVRQPKLQLPLYKK